MFVVLLAVHLEPSGGQGWGVVNTPPTMEPVPVATGIPRQSAPGGGESAKTQTHIDEAGCDVPLILVWCLAALVTWAHSLPRFFRLQLVPVLYEMY